MQQLHSVTSLVFFRDYNLVMKYLVIQIVTGRTLHIQAYLQVMMQHGMQLYIILTEMVIIYLLNGSGNVPLVVVINRLLSGIILILEVILLMM